MDTVSTVLVLFTIIVYGIWGFVIKLGVDKMGIWPAATIGFATSIAIGIAVTAFALSRAGSFSMNIYGVYIVIAVMLSTLGVLATYLLLERAQVSIIMPLLELYLFIPVILGVVVLGENLTTMQTIGVIFAVVAAILLAF